MELNQKATTDLRKAADEAFAALLPIWKDGLALEEDLWLLADYWKGGNTLDAAINYLVATKKKDDEGLVEKSYDLYIRKRDYPAAGAWRDDYGWWGNAFANAYYNADALGLSKDLRQNCLKEAKHCFGILRDSANENRIYGEANPGRRSIGADYCPWNNGSARDYVEDADGQFTYTPTPNTVTGGGFLSLALALAKIEGPNLYQNEITRSIAWLYYLAFQYAPPKPDPGFPETLRRSRSNPLLNDCHLVRETPTPWMHQAWCYDLDRAWSADQGVCLYNLLRVDSYSADPQTKFFARCIRENLLAGYKAYSWEQGEATDSRSVNSLLVDDVFHEFETKSLDKFVDGKPCFIRDTNLSNYNNNYCTGPGVFMRYLGYAYPMLDDEMKKLFLRVSAKSVESALAYRDPETKLIRCWYMPFEESPYWQYYVWDKDHNRDRDSDNKLWKLAPQVAGLDLLVAALKLIASENVSEP